MWAPVCSAAGAASVAATAAVLDAFLAALFLAVLFFAAGFSPVAVFLAAVFFDAVFFAVVLFAAVFLAAAFSGAALLGAAFPEAVSSSVLFAGAAPCPTGGSWVPSCSAAVSSAVFFATMAAAPSHIVILLANRAGTINRLQPRGNGARRLRALPVSGRGVPASVVPSSPSGNPASGSAGKSFYPVPPLGSRPRAADNRSAVARTGPYTGPSERLGWDE